MEKHRNNPKHVSIVMDGNGRWAKRRFMPRIAGHRVGAKVVRKAIRYCVDHQIEVLSLFALSVENFISRPPAEVKFLLSLFSELLDKELDELHQSNVRIRLIGDHSVFESSLREKISFAQEKTLHNTGLTLVIAANYSGRWDLLQAAKKMTKEVLERGLNPNNLTENDYSKYISLADLPEPDLLIRTSGEKRISNFMLWQLAYTELFFMDELWPDFDEHMFRKAIAAYQKRERRFGTTGDQRISRPDYVKN